LPIRVDVDGDDDVSQSPSQRLQRAEQISNFGMDEGWVESDPTRDQKFNLRLRRERAKKCISRIKLDAFHWFQRISNTTSKQHILFHLFMACLRDAVFYLDPREVEQYRAAKVAEGMPREEADRLPKSYFIKYGKCVRVIPSRIELAIRVQSVIELFDGLADADGNLLITAKSKKQLQNNMEHIWADCLSDPSGVNMYYDISTSDGGAPKLATIRGTSQLEGYHKQIRQMLKAKRITPELFEALLMLFNYRWNTNADIKHCAAHDYGFYRHPIFDRICKLTAGRVLDAPLYPSFRRTMSDEEVSELGIDDLSRVRSVRRLTSPHFPCNKTPRVCIDRRSARSCRARRTISNAPWRATPTTRTLSKAMTRMTIHSPSSPQLSQPTCRAFQLPISTSRLQQASGSNHVSVLDRPMSKPSTSTPSSSRSLHYVSFQKR
jgi:hypothetical protein